MTLSVAGDDVRFLSKRRIELEAALLLDDYADKHGKVTSPPVPVDAILENHLELSFSVRDLQAEFGVDDVHGAIWIPRREVGVDRCLDPELHPQMEGRYHFTLAHEVGHWQLHRGYCEDDDAPLLPFAECVAPAKPEYICRSGDRTRAEWQANYFASSLLMPERLVLNAWRAKYGENPMTSAQLWPHKGTILLREAMRRGSLNGGDDETALLFEWAARPLAMTFKVSPQAMRIRLEGIGLLTRTGPSLWS
jgi:Zn-dependent peptidase ImmA (M78 family)